MVKFLSMPYLVQKAVLERMGLLELFDFTRISRKMKNKVKNQVRIRNVELDVRIGNNVTFEFVSAKDRTHVCTFRVKPLMSAMFAHRYGLSHRNIGELKNVASEFRESVDCDSWMLLYLDDYLQGARTLYNEFLEIFAVPVEGGEMNLGSVGPEYRTASTLLKEIGPRRVIVYGENVDFQVYKWTLEHLPPLENLNCEVIPIEFVEREMPTLVYENIRIRYGFWMRPQHLELMPAAKEIRIVDSSFTGPDIKDVLLRLKSESHLNLERLHLHLRGTYEDDDVLEGLGAVEKEDNQDFDYMMEFDNGDSCEFALAHDGNDGDMIQVKINRTNNAQ